MRPRVSDCASGGCGSPSWCQAAFEGEGAVVVALCLCGMFRVSRVNIQSYYRLRVPVMRNPQQTGWQNKAQPSEWTSAQRRSVYGSIACAAVPPAKKQQFRPWCV